MYWVFHLHFGVTILMIKMIYLKNVNHFKLTYQKKQDDYIIVYIFNLNFIVLFYVSLLVEASINQLKKITS